MYVLGHGQASSETFYGIMDLAKPVAHNVQNEMNNKLLMVS